MIFPDVLTLVTDGSGYAVALVSGIAARPFLRALTKAITFLGALSAIFTWLSQHPKVKKVLVVVCAMLLLLTFVTGCSVSPRPIQTVDDTPVQKASPTAKVGLFGGDYCWKSRSILNVSRHNLSVCAKSTSFWFIPNLNEGCVDEKIVHKRSRLSFDECVKLHHGKVLIVNPGFKYSTKY